MDRVKVVTAGQGLNHVSASWDADYRAGRYADDGPLPFVGTIVSTLEQHPQLRGGHGLYVGCGNGRNYLPLVDAGLDLTGLDISAEALAQLAARRAGVESRLLCGDFRELGSAPAAFAYLIAIQVFQHGGDADVATYFARTAALLTPGGLFFLRVNSAATEVDHRHTVVDRNPSGGFTVRYDEGPKRGLLVHFSTREELLERTNEHFTLVMEPSQHVVDRAPPKTGSWAQWEAVWRRR